MESMVEIITNVYCDTIWESGEQSRFALKRGQATLPYLQIGAAGTGLFGLPSFATDTAETPDMIFSL